MLRVVLSRPFARNKAKERGTVLFGWSCVDSFQPQLAYASPLLRMTVDYLANFLEIVVVIYQGGDGVRLFVNLGWLG
jgi:hypothetical protein